MGRFIFEEVIRLIIRFKIFQNKMKKLSFCRILYIEKLFKEERSESVKNNQKFEYYVSEYMDMLYKLAFAYLKSYDDSNDVVQNVLYNFYKTNKEFERDRKSVV